MRKGIAHLPLHYGKAPAWLFGRMKKLARQMTIAIAEESGPSDFLDKISDPHWFQAFGCVLGFDWHSSGLTTTVCGALKEGLKDISESVGVFVCGGKGATSRKTPREIALIGERVRVGRDPARLVYASRMAAKVDSAALQDGYQLYQHTFFFTKNGEWAVVQQGMNTETRWARRYHWLGRSVKDFVREPHKAVCCDHKSEALNMVANESGQAREVSAAVAAMAPERTIGEFGEAKRLELSRHHAVSLDDIRTENLRKILVKTYENQPKDFETLLGMEGVGPKTVRALALISELIYGKSPSFRDPVRFSFAHGGKDGHPYPVAKETYDRSIEILRKVLDKTDIERSEKIAAFKRLARF